MLHVLTTLKEQKRTLKCITNEFLKVMNIRNYSGKDLSNLVLTFNSTMFTSSAMLEGKLKSKMLL